MDDSDFGLSDDATYGLNSDFGYTDPDIEQGVNGDGSNSSLNILNQILNSNVASSVAATAVTALVGGQKVIVNSNGSYQQIPSSQQGGTLGAQNKALSSLSTVPVWGWIVAGIAFLGGLIYLLKD